MIYLLSEEKFKKYAEDLAEPKGYVIVDATDYTNPQFRDYNGVVCWAGLNPPKKLAKAFAAEKKSKKGDYDFALDSCDDEIDKATRKKLFKKYKKSEGFKTSIMAILNALLTNEEEINVYIILRKNVFNGMSKKILKAIEEFLDITGANNCIYAYDLTDKKQKKKLFKMIKKNTSSHDRKVLKKRFNELKKELDKK